MRPDEPPLSEKEAKQAIATIYALLVPSITVLAVSGFAALEGTRLYNLPIFEVFHSAICMLIVLFMAIISFVVIYPRANRPVPRLIAFLICAAIFTFVSLLFTPALAE